MIFETFHQLKNQVKSIILGELIFIRFLGFRQEYSRIKSFNLATSYLNHFHKI